ncbi:hypothetical protein J8I82_37700 [Cupriavidus sp. LEh25]|nr:hypothetical protein [Cupriavidus sp. LEh25]
MVLDAVVERFIEHSPISVMARLGLQRALDPAWIDELFEQERETQYTRELLFSTTVGNHVAGGRRAAPVGACGSQGQSDAARFHHRAVRQDQPDRTGLVRALVQGSARRLGPVVQPMLRKQPPSVDGYRLRIVDGSHLPASEKRLKPLRGFRGAALPGQSLVVYDPDTAMIVDLVPCEDAHAQERAIARIGPSWRIVDRRSQLQHPGDPCRLAASRQRLHRARARPQSEPRRVGASARG